MYSEKSGMTVGAVVKYLTENCSLNSIDSLAQILIGYDRVIVRKLKGQYYVFIKLYSIEKHFTTLTVPFNWKLSRTPSVREGLYCAKQKFKLQSMINKKHA